MRLEGECRFLVAAVERSIGLGVAHAAIGIVASDARTSRSGCRGGAARADGKQVGAVAHQIGNAREQRAAGELIDAGLPHQDLIGKELGARDRGRCRLETDMQQRSDKRCRELSVEKHYFLIFVRK